MAADRRHKAFLQFLRKVLELPTGYSKDDLLTFRSLAARDFPPIAEIIDAYIRFAERADTDVVSTDRRSIGQGVRPSGARQMHLFDLLRNRRLFSSNTDLAGFAARILPNIKGHRFDKMSRGDIAARIIEYLETLDPRQREQLEASMRSAVASPSEKPSKSFFSQWEKIIKGIEL